MKNPTTTTPQALSMSNPENVERIKKLTNDFEQALLLSKDTATEWTHGRPMFLLHCDDELNLYFGAALESSPVDEIIRNPKVGVSMQDGRQLVFINGYATVESGQKLVERGWGKRLRPMLKDSESFEQSWCSPCGTTTWAPRCVFWQPSSSPRCSPSPSPTPRSSSRLT